MIMVADGSGKIYEGELQLRIMEVEVKMKREEYMKMY